MSMNYKCVCLAKIANKSPSDMAALLNISTEEWNEVLNGKRELSQLELIDLNYAFEVSPIYLLQGIVSTPTDQRIEDMMTAMVKKEASAPLKKEEKAKATKKDKIRAFFANKGYKEEELNRIEDAFSDKGDYNGYKIIALNDYTVYNICKINYKMEPGTLYLYKDGRFTQDQEEGGTSSSISEIGKYNELLVKMDEKFILLTQDATSMLEYYRFGVREWNNETVQFLLKKGAKVLFHKYVMENNKLKDITMEDEIATRLLANYVKENTKAK